MADTDMIINPVKEKADPELPVAGMLLVNPAEAEAGRRLARSRKGREAFLFNSRLMLISAASENKKPFFLAGPAVGAPMAVIAMEKLIALGAERLIVYGWCGSLTKKLMVGDILLPTWAVSNEGTSAHYPTRRRPESHARTRKLLEKGLLSQGITVQTGPVWTTDAPYRESVSRVKELGGQGVLGVDMEYGALVAAATFRQIELTAVFLVSDELWSGTWNPGFRTKDFKKKSRDILRYLADFCGELAV